CVSEYMIIYALLFAGSRCKVRRSRRCGRPTAPAHARSVDLDFLQLVDAEHLQGQTLVEGLRLAGTDLVKEVLLEADLRRVHPAPRRGPVDVARRNLRLRDEGDAAVAEIGEAHRVPGTLRVGLL